MSKQTFGDVDAMHLNAEHEYVLAGIVKLRFGADLWNGDTPRAEVTQSVGRHLVICNIKQVQLADASPNTAPQYYL